MFGIRVHGTIKTYNQLYENMWYKWVNYKKAHSKAVNGELGYMIQTEYNSGMNKIIPINEPPDLDAEIDENTPIGIIVKYTEDAVVYSLGIEKEDDIDRFEQLSERLKEGKVGKNTINNMKEIFKKHVDRYIDMVVGGNYLKYKDETKPKKIEENKYEITYNE